MDAHVEQFDVLYPTPKTKCWNLSNASSFGRSSTSRYCLATPTAMNRLRSFLPKEVVNATENFLATAYKGSVRVHSVPASSKDGKLYPQSNIDALLLVALKFIDRRMKNKPTAEPHPRSIFLLYVPAQDQDRLLTALDFCVFPVAMRKLAEFSDGRQGRNDDRQS